VAQVTKYLLYTGEALSSNPSPTPKKKNNNNKKKKPKKIKKQTLTLDCALQNTPLTTKEYIPCSHVRIRKQNSIAMSNPDWHLLSKFQ
jgi:hypothetical protein